jgi:hypothetical protein
MNRLKQPSTWAGLAVLLQVLGGVFPQYAPILTHLTAAAGSAAVVMNEAAQ